MTQLELFESLKRRAMEDYESYLSTMEQFYFDDIKHLKKRISLLDVYNKAVASNTSFRRFIADLNKPLS